MIIFLSTGKGQYIKGKESYNNPIPNPFLLKKSAMNHPHRIKVRKSLWVRLLKNKTPSVENIPYETIDKEDSSISVENHIYGHKDDSKKINPKIAVESWRKRKKRNYSYQVKPNLKSKWCISFKKPKENKRNIIAKKKKNSNALSHFIGEAV